MKHILLAALLAALCAGLSARAETHFERYWRLHRERATTTRYGEPPHGCTNAVTLLEYVESTGEQHVDTGITLRGGYVECDLTLLNVDSPGNWPMAFGKAEAGAASPWYPYRFGFYCGKASGGKPSYENGYRSQTWSRSFPFNFTLEKSQWRVTKPSSQAEWTDRSILLFSSTFGSMSKTRIRKFRLWDLSDNLVRDFRPVKDAAGVAGLLDMVSGEIFYSATETPLVAGPELRPATVLPTVSRETVREMLAPAPTGEPPELAGGDLWLDCLAIPEGNWLCECPIEGSTDTAWRAALCPSNILRAVVWRHATGIAPTNLPVTLEHDPSRVIGRIERLYYEAGTGVVARISVTQSGYAWAVAHHSAHPSPDVRAMYATNCLVSTNGWVHERQDYIDARCVPRGEDMTSVTNVPSGVRALVMAPVYLRGLSLVSVPLLPTYIEQPVPAHLRDVYPIRPPRQWTWRNGD